MSSSVTPSTRGARRVDVARHGEVDQQQRPAAARLHHRGELLGADDRVRRGGRGDHDVGALELAGSASNEPEAPPKRCASAIARSRRRLATNIVVTPCAWNARAVCSDVLAGADDHDVPRGQLAQRGARRVDRDRRHGGVPDRDRGLRAHALAGRQRGAEQPVGQRPGRARGQRALVGALDLALDLGLADDHRVQPADDAVEVPRGVAVARRCRAPALAPPARASSTRAPPPRASSPTT